MFRAMLLSLVVVGLGTALAVAANPLQDAKQHEGVVVSAADGKLTMATSDGTEKSHVIGDKVAITIDGKEAKLSDLKKGDKVTVSTNADGDVTAVSCKR